MLHKIRPFLILISIIVFFPAISAYSQEYYFQEDFETGASDDFAGWITGGEGVASTSGGVEGRGAKFRDAVSTLTTLNAYSWAGELRFSLMASLATDGADFNIYKSTDGGDNWTKIWTISYADLEAAPDKTVTETLSIDVEQTAVLIRFESVNGGGTNGDYPFILDNVSLSKKSIPQDNTGFLAITASCKTVSQEPLIFSESADGSRLYVAQDSVALEDPVSIEVEPLHPDASVVVASQPDPAPGSSDTIQFTVTSVDGSNSSVYKVVVARSTYFCKIGFLSSATTRPDGWSAGGGFYATSSRGDYGMYPGINGFRIYNSSNLGTGRLESPVFSSAGTLTFAAKFSNTDDESLHVSISRDGGASWTVMETYTPADGRIPSYSGEDAADSLALQKLVIDVQEPVVIRFSYEGSSTAPRTMLDDIAVTPAAGVASGDNIVLPRFITSNMVVQRNRPIRLWGWAEEGASVIGAFDGDGSISRDTALAGTAGKWELTFPAREVISTPCTITLEIEGAPGSSLQLENILVGDVWFAGGQSNMEKRVSHLIEADEVIANADLYPQIRSFKASYQMSSTPLDDVAASSIGWFECNSETTGDNVSAVAYIFALNVHLSENIPIGIIQAYRGGTEIETWMSQEKISSDENLFRVRARQEQMDPHAADAYRNYPSIHFNGQVHPFKSTPIKGFVFYQGESNTKRGLEYGRMMEALIDDWRSQWNLDQMPFYYVQLFNMGIASSRLYEEGNWQDTRDQQLGLLYKDIENTGMAVSIDTNEDPDNSDASIRIHPKNKKPIGERLALLALQHTYERDINGTSPVPSGSYVSNDTVYVYFSHVGTGLKTSQDGEQLKGFVVAGEERNFVAADAVFVNDSTLAIVSDAVAEPVAARYAWSKNPDCNLVNGAGLPASPFRTDDWPSGYNYDEAAARNSADLYGIRINGVFWTPFDNMTKNMVVDLPATVDNVQVSAEPVSLVSEVTISQPLDLNGTESERTATIEVVSYDGSIQHTYTVLFNRVPALDLFFALGQSNMAGRAPITGEVSAPIDGISLFNDLGNWEPAANPMNAYSNIRKDISHQKVGPSYTFAKTLSEYVQRDIGLVVNARGGTAIAAFARGEYRDPMFARLEEGAKFGELKGVIWHQGESDNSRAGSYMTDLQLLVGDLRSAFGDACFVAGQMGGWNAQGEDTPKYANINDTITKIKNSISNADYVTNEGLDHIGDYAHFNLESQVLLGQRYAKKVLAKVYDVDITILNVDFQGAGLAVYRGDTILQDRSWSYTAPAGTAQTMLIMPGEGKEIVRLVINGSEVTGITGATSYSYEVDAGTDTNLEIVIESGIIESVVPGTAGIHGGRPLLYPNPASGTINVHTTTSFNNLRIHTM
ncbi:MAG: sialate O-acetylesterase, partial [Bacteroidales bacterium]|nr:sialate O-acetylesterase [Bacteroidales bacterium]